MCRSINVRRTLTPTLAPATLAPATLAPATLAPATLAPAPVPTPSLMQVNDYEEDRAHCGPSKHTMHTLIHTCTHTHAHMQVNDYEEDNALYGHASIGSLSARITADQMCDAGCDPSGRGVQAGPDGPLYFSTITPLVITPHCHAPSCIREETSCGMRTPARYCLCNVSARYGVNDDVFNKRDYTAIPPCIYGHQPGLQAPFSLGPRVRLRAVKYFNNTYRHLGQMAQWTGLAVYTLASVHAVV